MARKRDHKAEYRRRIERGLARGLSRAQARGHAPRAKRSKTTKASAAKPDPSLEAAIRAMNGGKSLSSAARANHISTERLRNFITTKGLAKRRKRRWVMKDERPRPVPFITRSGSKNIVVKGFKAASAVARHDAAFRAAINSGDFDPVFAFRGKGVRDLKGKLHLFETDPNALYRYAMLGEPEFYEIYSITQP